MQMYGRFGGFPLIIVHCFGWYMLLDDGCLRWLAWLGFDARTRSVLTTMVQFSFRSPHSDLSRWQWKVWELLGSLCIHFFQVSNCFDTWLPGGWQVLGRESRGLRMNEMWLCDIASTKHWTHTLFAKYVGIFLFFLTWELGCSTFTCQVNSKWTYIIIEYSSHNNLTLLHAYLTLLGKSWTSVMPPCYAIAAANRASTKCTAC